MIIGNYEKMLAASYIGRKGLYDIQKLSFPQHSFLLGLQITKGTLASS